MTRASPPLRLRHRGCALLGLVCACANSPASPPDPSSAANVEAPRAAAPSPGVRPSDAAAPDVGASAVAWPEARCGGSPCPLRTFMKTQVAPALEDRDLGALGSALDQLATLAPPGYTNWAAIARDGADAARVQPPEAVRAACRGCHSQYRERYKRELGIRGL
jgi:hypothetical protein